WAVPKRRRAAAIPHPQCLGQRGGRVGPPHLDDPRGAAGDRSLRLTAGAAGPADALALPTDATDRRRAGVTAPAWLASRAATFSERAASVGTQVHASDRAEATALIARLLADDLAARVCFEPAVPALLPDLLTALAAAGMARIPAEDRV